MIKLGQRVIDSFLSEEIFEYAHLQEVRNNIKKVKEVFANRAYESFTATEIEEMQKHIQTYQQIIQKPHDYFRVNHNFIEIALEVIEKDSFWEQYSSTEKYTEDSIAKTQSKFRATLKNIEAITEEEARHKALFAFYKNTFQPFLKDPFRKLSKKSKPKTKSKPKPKIKTTYQTQSKKTNTTAYSSSSSSSHSNAYSSSPKTSYSDYSDYSDSYSDFGGGSFGGGGAEGSW